MLVGVTAWHVVAFDLWGQPVFNIYVQLSIIPAGFDQGVQRRIDHSRSTYLSPVLYPICLVPLREPGWSLFGVSGTGCSQIIMTILWFEAPRWLTTLIYVLMGWLSNCLVPPYTVSRRGTSAGGRRSSVQRGAIIYATKCRD